MDNKSKKTLGQMIREARDKRDLSQRELAKLVGCSHTAIGNLEKDDVQKVDMSVLGNIIVLLEMPVAETISAAGYNNVLIMANENKSLGVDEWNEYLDKTDTSDPLLDTDGSFNYDKYKRFLAKESIDIIDKVIKLMKQQKFDEQNVLKMINSLLEVKQKQKEITVRHTYSDAELARLSERAGKNS